MPASQLFSNTTGGRNLAASMLLAATIACAQGAPHALQLQSVQTGSPATVSASCSQGASSDRIGAGVDVANGLLLQATNAGSEVALSAFCEFSDQRFSAQFSANGLTNNMSDPAAAASAGPAKLVVTLMLPQSMRLKFGMNSASIAAQGTPSQSASVDIGDDASPELVFVSRPGVCDNLDRTIELDVPAGKLVISFTIALHMPLTPACRFNRFACVFGSLSIEPAHVEVTPIGQACGGTMEVTPLLDGEGVRFYGGPMQLGGFSCIVLGTAPTHVQLPFSLGCSLLVSPELVVAQPIGNYLVLPITHLGPMDLYAQAVVWMPQWLWQPAQFVASGHSLLRVH
jgi:hypothetical protein